ncbi:MAG: FAD:protein FMN transferase [Alistipes sp.]|nr:FAD:protein FMN transferase [Alistipes sp.]
MRIFTIIVVALLFASCSSKAPHYRTIDGAMLGTTYHIIAETTLSSDAIFNEMQRINLDAISSMSIFNHTSLLSRINRNECDTVDIHIARNIEIAAKVNALTPRYDITVKPLVEAYGFAAKSRDAHPNIDSLIQFVGFSKFRLEGSRIIKQDSRLQIDLNSIAKGYVVDLIAEWLDKQGSKNYIVEVGGEIRAKGVNAKGIAWRVGVDTPFDNNNTPGAHQQRVVQISGAALATSGNYRRFYYNDAGERISHTLNPQTGNSHTTTLLSATVIAPRCATADALATAFMASDEKDAIALATSLRDSIQVYFVLAPEGKSEQYREFSTLVE